jgi:ribosomal protein L32
MMGRVLRPAPGKTDALILDHSGSVFVHGFPDDLIIWTLQEDRRAENRAHSARGQHHHAPALTTCPECSAVRMEGRPCPVCGWRPVKKPKPLDVADGDLGEVGRDRNIRLPPFDRLAFHRRLAWIAAERGYKPGWVAHQYKQKFGDWPKTRSVEPLAPDAATRAWVRSRQIAFAKSQAAQ